MKSLRYSTVIAATIALTSAMSLQAQTTTPQRRVLMEEYTGTWCSNCPRGIASIEHLQKKYGDRFIAVAIHQDSYDPMKTKLYASGNGYPSCQLNRSINCDPFFGTDWDYSDPIGVIHDIDKLMKQTCYADVSATAQWKDNTHTSIEVTATAVFTDTQQASYYRWAFVVTEDHVTAPDPNDRYWKQQNKYVGDTDWLVMPEMDTFVNGSSLMAIEYNHVVVDGSGIRQGIENSVSDPVVAQQPNTFTYTIDISENTLIQDASNLNVVAILLNTRYNDVENAAITAIAPSGDGATAVSQVKGDDVMKQHDVYNLQGQKMNNKNTRRGIVIIDGKKVAAPI